MSKVNKILIFSEEYPPYNWGGVAPFTINLVNGLSALGIEVTLVTIGERDETYVQENGVVIVRIGSSGLYKDEYIEEDLGFKRHLSFLRAVKSIYTENNKPDAVILADGLCYPEAKYCAKHFNIPLVSMVNQVFKDVSSLWKGKLNPMVELEKKYFAGSDHLVVGSDYMKNRLVDLGLGNKTTHIYYGWGYNEWVKNCEQSINPQILNSDFLFIGRMVPEKGLVNLLNAFKKVLAKNDTLSLNVVGDGDEKKNAIEYVSQNQMDRNVRFYSAISWQSVRFAFKKSKVTIVPSYNEPFGYVGLESLMYGSMPLVSHPTGLSEIVSTIPYDCLLETEEQENYIRVPCIDGLVEKMLATISLSEEKREELIALGRVEASKRFNYITIASSWLHLIESLVTNKTLCGVN